MSMYRMRFLVPFLSVLVLLTVSKPGPAQSGAGSFGTVAIGRTSSVQSVTVTFTVAGTVTTQLALTEGAEHLDFAVVSGGSCATGQSYAAGGSCTVSVTFAPLYAGLRKGAVVLKDANSVVLASTYISGVGSGPQAGFHVASRQLSTFPNITFPADRGIAVDGNGNLFVASIHSGNTGDSVVEVPAGCTAQSCVKQLPGTFAAVQGLAVDGAGNLWVGDRGASGSITEILAAGAYSTAKVYEGSFGYQTGVAVDGAGNVYFTGGASGSAENVTELLVSSGYATAQTLTSGYNPLGGIAVDSSGDVFFADPYGQAVQEIVAVNGSIPSTPTIKSLGSGLKNLSGIALDGGGNLYALGSDNSGFGMIFELPAASGYSTVTELSNQTNPVGIALDAGGNLFGIYYTNQALGGISTNAIFELPRSTAPSLVFPTPTAPGAIDTADGQHKVLIENIGNQPLSLAGLTVSNGNFSLDPNATTCTASTTLAVGDSCLLAIVFNPLTTGANITGTITITDNTLNADSVTQSIALSGRSQYTPLVHIALASSVVAVSQALPLTVTVNGGTGNPTPTGTIQITAPGYSSGPVPLSAGSAAVTVPAGTLSPGQPTIVATYQPDTASASNFTSAAVQTTIIVTSTIMNVPEVTVTPAVPSISLGQALTVTVGVSQANGSPVPTGTITLTGGIYTSPAIALSGGTVTITIPANSLFIGTNQLLATYTPDAAGATIYLSAKGTGFVAVSAAPPPAGAAPTDFGSLDIGKTSAMQAVTLTFPGNSTPATLIATTQGATGKDFAIVSGGSCGAGVNVASGQSCTVNVTFTPAFAGVRSGAVVALDADGKTLALTYVHGSGTGAQISIQSNPYFGYSSASSLALPFSFTTLSDGFSRPNVAVDGAGNIFVADMDPGAVREIPAGCTSASCTVTVLEAFYGPSALAVDGAGNIFVAETGYGDVKKIPLGCKSYSCLETVGTGFNQPYGVAVDANGNVFVADTFNNAIKEVVAAGGYSTINTLASGLDLPWSVVVNAGGDLFVAQGGDQCQVFIPGTCLNINTSLLQITASSGYKTVKTLSAGGFGKPFGMAIDGGGNVYEADYGDWCATEYPAGSGYATARRLCASSFFIYPEGLAVDSGGNLYLDDVIKGAVYKMDFVDVPSMTFKTATLKGVADVQDGTQVVSVQNNGTAPLTFTSIGLSDNSFTLDNKITTCSTSTPLAAGASCYLAVNFAPTTTGPLPGTLTLTDNNLNQNPATQVIQIVAVALPPTPVILTNPPTTTTSSSAAFTFSDTQTPITFVCSIDSLPFSPCTSPATYSVSGGPHSFQVKAKDSAGNLSQAAVYNWTVNSVGPPAPVITSAPAAYGNADTATFVFTDAQPGVSYLCSLDGATFASCSSGISYSGLSVSTTSIYLLFKWHSFAVEAQDNAGNVSPEATWTWLITNYGGSGSPVNFGALPVGQTSAPQTVTFTFSASDTIATINATTMGITGLDYAISDPGTCAVGTAVSKGSTCTLKVTFAPKFAGQRKGGVVLLDAAGTGIGVAYLEGTGTAPQVTFTPYSTLWYNMLPPQNDANPGLNLVSWITDAAVDGAGNIYVSEGLRGSGDGTVVVNVGGLWEIPTGCTTAPCAKLLAEAESGGAQYSSTTSVLLPQGLVIDGTGLLWVANWGLGATEFSTVGSGYSTQCLTWAGGSNFSYLKRAGLDGAGRCSILSYTGQLYVDGSQVGVPGQAALRAASAAANQQKPDAVGGGGYTGPSFDFSTNTTSMTVDPLGNIFVADAGNNAVKEVLASSNFTIDRTVGSGFNNPTGVTSDAFGNIFVADAGNNAIKEITAASGYTQVLTIATFDPKVLTLGNFTIDAAGNFYLSNSAQLQTNQLAKLDFSDAPSLTFPTATKIGTTDTTDGTLTATVKNSGNQPLTISGLALSNTNFLIDAGATTCSASAPLAVGASCTIGVLFTPNATGALTGTLTLTDNALNVSGATQQFALSGTAYLTPTTATPTVAVAPASSTITTAQTDAVTVTVSGATGHPIPTGTVSLFGGSYTSPVVALSAGQASFTIPAGILAIGSTTLNAVYTPDTASSTTYGTGAGAATISVTAVAASTPVVTVTPATINISTQQSLAVTIAVSGVPTPMGSVTLSGGNYASLATTLINGSATITIPAGYLPAGTIQLTGYYTPDAAGQANYTSASGTGLVSVEAAARITPAVKVTPASASISSSQPLLVTMQVSADSSRSTPTGFVVLSSGSYVSAAAALSNGSVIVSIPAGALAVGTDTLTATYSPDNAGTLTFNSAAGSGSVTVTAPLASTTTLQASATSIAFGAGVTFSVVVTPASGVATPTGSVALMDGPSTLTTLTLNASGAASYSTTALSAGTHSIIAAYAGDANNSASTSAAVTVTVAPPLVATTTRLQASATSIVAGGSLSLTATVVQTVSPAYHAAANPPAVPTGTVAFLDGATTLGSAALDASGVASFSTTALATGSHSITAFYSGDTSDAPSTSAAVTVTVAAPAPVASVTPSSLSFTAVIATTSPAQPITLTNTGNAALTIAGISIGGTNASAFAQTNTCGEALDVGANCTISVTFTPPSAASFSATLSVTDNAGGSPQTVALSGTGTPAPGFTISATTSTQTVQAGGTGSFTITVTPKNGAFNNAVSFTATGLPPGATATFSPSTVTPGSAAATTTMSIQTAARTAQNHRVSLWPTAGPALALIGILLLPRGRRRQWLALCILFLGSLGALTLSGCGGGFALKTTSATTYTITVVGASGGDSQTTTVQLTVQ